jgi:hypothetical protein
MHRRDRYLHRVRADSARRQCSLRGYLDRLIQVLSLDPNEAADLFVTDD